MFLLVKWLAHYHVTVLQYFEFEYILIFISLLYIFMLSISILSIQIAELSAIL